MVAISKMKPKVGKVKKKKNDIKVRHEEYICVDETHWPQNMQKNHKTKIHGQDYKDITFTSGRNSNSIPFSRASSTYDQRGKVD